MYLLRTVSCVILKSKKEEEVVKDVRTEERWV